jgi:FAD/FMN-containing dehydrogenase
MGVRTFGTGHSFTPIIETAGLLLDTQRLRGVIEIDAARQQVTALPKTTVGDFGEPLWEAGLALANQGDIDTQAIAGAIATGTHGSGNHLVFRRRCLALVLSMAWAIWSPFPRPKMPMCCRHCRRRLACWG